MDSEDAQDHSHCKTCYRTNCVTKTPGLHCPIIRCELRCGARFHGCKQEEHKDSCELEKVECINFVNGCPLMIQRNRLGAHLERCPASVVSCTMEWNRWPVYSNERQSRVPFVADNQHAQRGQLDVALALRDQRMLNQAMKAPRSTRRALSNNLTQRFPAVPIRLTSNAGGNSGTPSPPDTSQEIQAWKDAEHPATAAENSSGNVLFRESLMSIKKSIAARSTSGTGTGESADSLSADSENEGGLTSENRDGIYTSLENCTASEPPCTGVANGNHRDSFQDTETEDSVQHPSCDVGPGSPPSPGDGKGEVKITEQELDNAPVVCSIPPPPCAPPLNPVSETLGLDLNLESITRYQAKPRSMYTFLCAQEFRRDEYSGHCRNVHDQIHSGLNGWLEQRCPLAHYGCPYSIRRLYAGERGAEIVYNSILESFGVKPHLPAHQRESKISDSTPEKALKDSGKKSSTQSIKSPSKFLLTTDNTYEMECNGNIDPNVFVSDKNEMNVEGTQQPMSLTSLPFEVLRYMALFLDGYSLCNLALTSRHLREVASSLLEEKGIVIQQWEKRLVNGRPSWDISHKRWIFSTAFSSVNEWGFEHYKPLGDHLKTCPFYHRVQTSTPHHLPSIKCGQHHSDNFYTVMRRMYPDFTVHHDEQEPTCTAGAGLC